MSGPDYEWFRYMEETIQKHFVGPDCYWKPLGVKPRGCTKFFGSAWWVPFPPTLVSQTPSQSYWKDHLIPFRLFSMTMVQNWF